MRWALRLIVLGLSPCLSASLAMAQAPYQPPYQPQPQQQYQPPPQQYQPPPQQYQAPAQPYQAPAQPYQGPPPQSPGAYSPGELVQSGHRFFGGVSRGFATIIEKAVSQWGLPNGYVLGEEAGGAFFGGLRYGEGILYTKNAGDLKVFWQGPSLGWDFGGQGARTMVLVYSLPSTQAIYQRFGGLNGSAYFIGGFGMTAVTANNIVLVPIQAGVGFRLGANVGYLKFTPESTWNPF